MSPSQYERVRALELLLEDNELAILEARVALTLSERLSRGATSRISDTEDPELIRRRYRHLRIALEAQARRRHELVREQNNRRALLEAVLGGGE